jgi:hypothetical protein
MTRFKVRVQVPPEHYWDPKYRNPDREWSFAIQEGHAAWPGILLEIGIGPGILSQRLRARGHLLVTVDIDPRLAPDVAASVTLMPFRDRSFSTVLAFEVLEHLPLELLPAAIHEVCRTASDRVVISVPEKTDRLKTFVSLRILRRTWNDPQHHWELGLFMSKSRFLRLFAREGFGLAEYDASHPVHRFFVFTPTGRPPPAARWFMMRRGRRPSGVRPAVTARAE